MGIKNNKSVAKAAIGISRTAITTQILGGLKAQNGKGSEKPVLLSI